MTKQTKQQMIEFIARACHEANKVWCEANNDFSQKHWASCKQWQKDSAIKGVKYRLNNPKSTPEDMHRSWCAGKIQDGWKHGEVKDDVAKTHPCLVKYDELPEFQKVKDRLFISIVDSLNTVNGVPLVDAPGTRFEITEDHLKVIRELYVEHVNDSTNDPILEISIPCPQGQYDTYSVAVMLGLDVSDDFTGEPKNAVYKLINELETVLQICLATQEFKTGVFIKTGREHNHWVRYESDKQEEVNDGELSFEFTGDIIDKIQEINNIEDEVRGIAIGFYNHVCDDIYGESNVDEDYTDELYEKYITSEAIANLISLCTTYKNTDYENTDDIVRRTAIDFYNWLYENIHDDVLSQASTHNLFDLYMQAKRIYKEKEEKLKEEDKINEEMVDYTLILQTFGFAYTEWIINHATIPLSDFLESKEELHYGSGYTEEHNRDYKQILEQGALFNRMFNRWLQDKTGRSDGFITRGVLFHEYVEEYKNSKQLKEENKINTNNQNK